MAKRTSFADMNCSLARALDVVGEWWSLLVVREVYFGRRSFTEIRETLGIARNILSDRLGALVAGGVLERTAVGPDRRRTEYHLTDKGRDLVPVLVMLMQWGDRWEDDGEGPPIVLTHRETGADLEPVLVDAASGRVIDPGSIRLRRGPGFRNEAWPAVVAGPQG